MKMKNNLGLNKQIKFIILGSLIAIGGIIVPKIIVSNNLSYINGNILNLPYLNASYSTLNRFQSPWINQQIESSLMYRSLFTPDSTLNNLEPDLAENYITSNGSKTYDIFLSGNSYWSDGERITVDDVVFSIEAMAKSTNINNIFTLAIDFIVGADDYKNGKSSEISGISVDNNIITIVLTEPYSGFMPSLSQAAILPKHILKNDDIQNLDNSDYWENPVTSGMYKFNEVVENDGEYYYSLTKNKNYKDKKSDIDEIRIHVNYREKELDYYSTNNVIEIEKYNNSPDYTEYVADMLLYRYFVFNVSDKTGYMNTPIDDVRVREAIMCAIDRETLLNEIYSGNGEILNSGLAISRNLGNNFEYEYDLDKSKRLLEEANYDFNRPIVIAHYYTDELSYSFLEEIAKTFATIGIKVNLVYKSSLEEIYTNKEYDLLYKGLSAFNEHFWYDEYSSTNLNMNNLFSWTGEFDGIYQDLYHSKNDMEYNEQLKIVQNWEQEKMYKLPMFTLDQKIFIKNSRVDIPINIYFGNPWYRSDISIEDWSIKRN